MTEVALGKWQPVWNEQVSTPTPVCVDFELHPGSGDIQICWCCVIVMMKLIELFHHMLICIGNIFSHPALPPVGLRVSMFRSISFRFQFLTGVLINVVGLRVPSGERQHYQTKYREHYNTCVWKSQDYVYDKWRYIISTTICYPIALSVLSSFRTHRILSHLCDSATILYMNYSSTHKACLRNAGDQQLYGHHKMPVSLSHVCFKLTPESSSDVSCLWGLPMASGICVEIFTKSSWKWSRNRPKCFTIMQCLTNLSLFIYQLITTALKTANPKFWQIFWEATFGPNKRLGRATDYVLVCMLTDWHCIPTTNALNNRRAKQQETFMVVLGRSEMALCMPSNNDPL